ncbi:EAL domain-containing protein [Hydrogenivirga sp.]
MIKFGVCPHDVESGRSKWEDLARRLSRVLGEQVVLRIFGDMREEEDLLERENFDIYYASPSVALRLRGRGYVPAARYRLERDTLHVVKRRETTLSGKPVVGVIPSPFSLLPLIKLFGNVSGFTIRLFYDYGSLMDALKKGKVQLAVVYGEFLKEYGLDEGIEVVSEGDVPTRHVFMVKEHLLEDFLKAVDSIPELVRVTEEEEEFMEETYLLASLFLDYVEKLEVIGALEEVPHIGFVVYVGDRIVYADSSAASFVGEDADSLVGRSILEFIHADEDTKRSIERMLSLRAKGEGENAEYELKIRRRDGSLKYVLAYSRTVFYRGAYAGVSFLVDITKRKRLEDMYELVKEVNHLTISSLFEEEFFEKLCSAISRRLNLKSVWIGVPGDRRAETFHVCGGDCDLSGDFLPPLNSPEGESYTSRDVVVIEDVASSHIPEERKEELLRGGVRSIAVIPLLKFGEPVGVLSLYSEESRFFTEDVVDALNELRGDVSFSLEKMEETRKAMLISKALDSSKEWVLITDEEGRILYVNEGVMKLSGYEREELIGRKPSIFKSGYQTREFYEKLWNTILSGETFESTFVNRKKNGELFYLDMSIIPLELPGRVRRFLAIGKDITREVSLSEEIERLKFRDVITGLYNFDGLSFKAEEYLTQESGGIFSLIILDIYNFTYVNSTFGIGVGDKLLTKVAELLKGRFREDDVIAKVGGDEFGVFLRLNKKEDALLIRKDLELLFEEPLQVGSYRIKVGINAGIALYPDDAKNFLNLYECASLALSEAKKEGADTIKFYDPTMEGKAKDYVRKESLIDRAIREGLFTFYYQPYFYTDSLRVAGLEALVRIRDRDGNVYGPQHFIDILERSPLLRDFENWALEEVINDINRWDMPVSLNISANSFKHEEFIKRLINVAKVWSAFLTVEITERILVEDREETKRILEELKFYGGALRVAVDDFGTGFSSLTYLSELPVDIIKIDMSFTRRVAEDERIRGLVEGVVHIARSLGMKTVAEGVEDEEQLEVLKDIGCDMVQGYYLARPMPREDIDLFLAKV